MREFFAIWAQVEGGADELGIVPVALAEEQGESDDFAFPHLSEEAQGDAEAALFPEMLSEGHGEADAFADSPLLAAEAEGGAEALGATFASAFEDEGAAEALAGGATWVEDEGAAESWAVGAVTFSDDEGHSEAFSLAMLEAVGEDEGADDDLAGGATLYEDEGGAEVVPLLTLVAFEDEGGAEALGDQSLLVLEDEGGAEALAGGAAWFEGEGHAEVLVAATVTVEAEGAAEGLLPATVTFEDEGHATNRHAVDLQGEVEADTFTEHTATASGSEFDADDPLRVDDTNERFGYLRFLKDYLKRTLTFGTDPTKPSRREYGELLVLQMDADDDGATTTTDRSPWAFSVAKVGTVTQVDGKFGKAYSFGGAGNLDLLETGANKTRWFRLLHGHNATFGFWMKRNGNPGSEEGLIANKTSLAAADAGWAVTLTTAGRIKYYVSDGVTQYTFTSNGTTGVVDDAWHKVVVKREVTGDDTLNTGPAVTFSVRIDGAANGSDVIGDAAGELPQLPAAGPGLTIAAIGGAAPTNRLNGSMDEVRILARAVPTVDMDAILDNPYVDAQGNARTIETAELKVNVEVSDAAVARTLRVYWLWDHFDSPTLNGNRRPIRNLAPLDNGGLFVDHTIPALASGARTIALSADMVAAMQAFADTGRFHLLLTKAGGTVLQLSSKEDATAASRPQAREVLAVA